MILELTWRINFSGPKAFFKSLFPVSVKRKNRPKRKKDDKSQLRLPLETPEIAQNEKKSIDKPLK